MNAKCVNCFNYLAKHQACYADLWSRTTDGFLKTDDDYQEYINSERFCTDFSVKNIN